MGPGRYGGIGTTIGAAAAAVVVALAVIAMVAIGGGMNHPLVAQPAMAMTTPPPGQG
ncbi:MAG TPA: hypothetical protein VGF50_11795 [Caulobacteraceae bacterium]